jgi:hypothetical protein
MGLSARSKTMIKLFGDDIYYIKILSVFSYNFSIRASWKLNIIDILFQLN